AAAAATGVGTGVRDRDELPARVHVATAPQAGARPCPSEAPCHRTRCRLPVRARNVGRLRHDAQMKSWLIAMTAPLRRIFLLLVVVVARLGTLQGQVDDVTNNVAGIQPAAPPDTASGDVCRFIGAWAAKTGVPLDQVFTDTTVTPCEEAAQSAFSAA